jgi:hypothetical protein
MTILTQIVELEEELKGLEKEKQDTHNICALSGVLRSYSANSIPTFRDSLSVPSTRVLEFLTLENGTFLK